MGQKIQKIKTAFKTVAQRMDGSLSGARKTSTPGALGYGFYCAAVDPLVNNSVSGATGVTLSSPLGLEFLSPAVLGNPEVQRIFGLYILGAIVAWIAGNKLIPPAYRAIKSALKKKTPAVQP